jgi:hypothetical protein
MDLRHVLDDVGRHPGALQQAVHQVMEVARLER